MNSDKQTNKESESRSDLSKKPVATPLVHSDKETEDLQGDRKEKQPPLNQPKFDNREQSQETRRDNIEVAPRSEENTDRPMDRKGIDQRFVEKSSRT